MKNIYFVNDQVQLSYFVINIYYVMTEAPLVHISCLHPNKTLLLHHNISRLLRMLDIDLRRR